MNRLRDEINDIDACLAALFRRRMDVVERIAAHKRDMGLPALDGAREERVLANARAVAGERDAADVSALYAVVLDLSRARQRLRMDGDAEPQKEWAQEPLPQGPVAYVGGDEEAARACQAGFPGARARIVSTWADVLRMAGEGGCAVGLLPAEPLWPLADMAAAVRENTVSIAGSVQAGQFFCFVRGRARIAPDADRLALLLPWPDRPDALAGLAARMGAHGVTLEAMRLQKGWAALMLAAGPDPEATRAYARAMRLEHPDLLLVGAWRASSI